MTHYKSLASTHRHCMHPYYGVILMVVPDGHVLMKCCHCEYAKTVHRAHVKETP